MSMKFPLAFLLLLMTSCSLSDGKEQHHVKVYSDDMHNLCNYQFKSPDVTLKLNSVLTEISGLGYDASTQNLLAVNDEQGMLYELRSEDGEIVGDHEFRGSGDYEGVEIVDEIAYVLKSDGKIYRVDGYATVEIETPLSAKNDVEGLGYDNVSDQLLLACKSKPMKNDYAKGSKAIYAYNLNSNTFVEQPFLLIKRKAVTQFLEEKDASESVIKRARSFSPSGIAIHPQTKDVYVISAVESVMLVYSSKHILIQCVFLDKGKVPQPEGICFSAEGVLFMSTEGKGKSGRIFMYSPIVL